MSENLQFCCADMKIHVCEMSIILYNEVFNEYSILVFEDSNSAILLNYCPWCGKKLPESNREEWVSRLEKMGFEAPIIREDIPAEYKTNRWWKDFG